MCLGVYSTSVPLRVEQPYLHTLVEMGQALLPGSVWTVNIEGTGTTELSRSAWCYENHASAIAPNESEHKE